MDQREIDKMEEEAEEELQKQHGRELIQQWKQATQDRYQRSFGKSGSRKRGKGYTRADKDQPKKKRLMAKQSRKINRHKWYKTKRQRV